MKCRFCKTELHIEFIDLVNSPPSNSFLNENELNYPETFYPLKLYVCHKCFLVQIDEFKKHDEIFSEDYAYFSSFSTSWLEHCEKYVEMVTKRFDLNEKSSVMEVASNDGYLLQFFVKKGIPVLGIEPTASTAKVAREKNIETIEDFFGVALAKRLREENGIFDLIAGNNVLAHVPDVNDFVEGLKISLKNDGIITMEFPHLMQLVLNNQFDTIYHEHFSYFSFFTVKRIFETHKLELFDVEEIPTHGGSLRIYAKHAEDESKEVSSNVNSLIKKELQKGINNIDYYKDFQKSANKIKYDLINFLVECKQLNKTTIAYGAAAKGNTLLNYCGIKKDLISFVVDKSPHKQGKYLPGSHIPVFDENQIHEKKPDYVLILPWNIKDEIIEQLSYIRKWDGKFIIPIPKLEII